MNDKGHQFQTLEELNDLLDRIGLRLHSRNRIAAGESVFLWHLAETIRATGRLALTSNTVPHSEGSFGSGYERESITRSDQLDHFLSLLMEEMEATR
jgi:hypothetical protein